jgi:hypothetical protein
LQSIDFHLLHNLPSAYCLLCSANVFNVCLREWHAIKRLRQGVTLTALDSSSFDAILEGIAVIYAMFSKEVQSEGLLAWTPGKFRSWPTISAFNSYFSPQYISEGDEIVPFHPDVDPRGILGKIDQSHWRHTADNAVGYFQRVQNSDNSFK